MMLIAISTGLTTAECFLRSTGPALAALADPLYNKDVAFGFGNYQVVDPYKVWDAYKSKLTFVALDDVRNFTEKNIAGFLRADVNATSDLLLIGGARWEKREIDARAQSRANGRSKPAHVDLEYAEWYPSLQFQIHAARKPEHAWCAEE